METRGSYNSTVYLLKIVPVQKNEEESWLLVILHFFTTFSLKTTMDVSSLKEIEIVSKQKQTDNGQTCTGVMLDDNGSIFSTKQIVSVFLQKKNIYIYIKKSNIKPMTLGRKAICYSYTSYTSLMIPCNSELKGSSYQNVQLFE